LKGFTVEMYNGTYYLYYEASKTSDPLSSSGIGLAISTDGINFTKHSGNPIIRSGVDTYDYVGVGDPVVYVENGSWRMWYHGNRGSSTNWSARDINICYATSSDGSNWTKDPSNPVLLHNTAGWNSDQVRPCSITRLDSGEFSLYVTGVNMSASRWLGLATMIDGVGISYNSSNPLRRASNTSWEKGDATYGSMEVSNGSYRMWISADPLKRSIGYISSVNGINWTLYSKALLSPKSNTNYSKHLIGPVVIDEGSHYKLYSLVIGDDNTSRIGAFKVIPKKLKGEFISRTFGPGGIVSLESLRWSAEVPKGGMLSMFARWRNQSGQFSDWEQINGSNSILNVTAAIFQYKAIISADIDWINIRLDDVLFRYRIPLDRVEVSVDGGLWQPVNVTFLEWYAEWYVNLTLRDGDYNVTVRAVDNVGTVRSEEIPVRVDLYPPTGSVILENGSWATNSAKLGFRIEGNDTHNLSLQRIGFTSDLKGTTWTEFSPNGSLDYTGPDGNVTVFASLTDEAGRESAIFNDTIIVDTTPPVGQMEIDGGSSFSNSTTVTISLTWSDLTGVTGMMVSNDPTFQGLEWTDPMTIMNWTLEEGSGTRNVYIRIRDAVGWASDLSDSIILDMDPPSASISINHGDTYTVSSDVVLNIDITDFYPVKIRLVNDVEPWPPIWTGLEPPIEMAWVLAPGQDGLRTVSLHVRDMAGNDIIATDGIILDTTPPGAELQLNNGYDYVNDALVNGFLNASDVTSGIDAVRISNRDDFIDALWQPPLRDFTWMIDPGEGMRTVYVQVRDLAGLITTVNDSVILDITPPSGWFTIGNDPTFSISSRVRLSLNISDALGLDGLRISNDPSLAQIPWRQYSSDVLWNLSTPEGSTTVYLEARDLAGNIIALTNDTVLDLTDPEIRISINQGDEATTDPLVVLSWSGSDINGLDAFCISLDPDAVDIAWRSLDGSPSVENAIEEFLLLGSDGLITVNLHLRDVAGRVGTGSDTIWYVSELPEGILVLGDGSGWTNSPTVTAKMTWSGGSTASHYRTSTSADALPSAEWHKMDSISSVDLSGPDGSKHVIAQLRGPHNITSIIYDQTIILDTIPPTVMYDAPSNGQTSDPSLTIKITVVDDLDGSPGMEWRLDGGDWIVLEVPRFVATLDEGEHLIEVRATDAAGNSMTEPWEITMEGPRVSATTSFIIIIIIIIVIASVGLWVRKRTRGRDADTEGT
jgi:hypothetical protein